MSGACGNAEPAAITPHVQRQLEIYLDMLLLYNRAINLVGFDNKRDIFEGLVRDSFYLARFLRRFTFGESAQIWDLGAGAGLPGIPLRMAWQDGHYTMIEVRQKRALFLENVLARINLPRTSVFRGSAEQFFAEAKKRDGHGLASCIVSRAFRPWTELPGLCRPRLARGAPLIIMANSRPPAPPEPWLLQDSFQYSIRGSERWLWALSPDPVSRGDTQQAGRPCRKNPQCPSTHPAAIG